jgi:death-on-curing protein
VQHHPFIDGNKRVGAATALVFLTMNGVETKMTNQALVDMVLTVAKGEMDKPAIAEFFRKCCRE